MAATAAFAPPPPHVAGEAKEEALPLGATPLRCQSPRRCRECTCRFFWGVNVILMPRPARPVASMPPYLELSWMLALPHPRFLSSPSFLLLWPYPCCSFKAFTGHRYTRALPCNKGRMLTTLSPLSTVFLCMNTSHMEGQTISP